MNTKLIFVITALIATSSVFAGECPGRAGVCDQRIVTKGTLY